VTALFRQLFAQYKLHTKYGKQKLDEKVNRTLIAIFLKCDKCRQSVKVASMATECIEAT